MNRKVVVSVSVKVVKKKLNGNHVTFLHLNDIDELLLSAYNKIYSPYREIQLRGILFKFIEFVSLYISIHIRVITNVLIELNKSFRV